MGGLAVGVEVRQGLLALAYVREVVFVAVVLVVARQLLGGPAWQQAETASS